MFVPKNSDVLNGDKFLKVAWIEQEPVTPGLSDSSCDDLDSSQVQEESGSEGSLASITPAPQQPVLAPLPHNTNQPMESAISQHQARPAPSVFSRHRCV